MTKPRGSARELFEAQQTIALLREDLREQWEYNHSEHCDRDWPHPEGERCHWPLPPILVDHFGREAAGGGMREWRVGRHYAIHVYEGDRPVATFHREEDARRCVDAIAAVTSEAEPTEEPEDDDD